MTKYFCSGELGSAGGQLGVSWLGELVLCSGLALAWLLEEAATLLGGTGAKLGDTQTTATKQQCECGHVDKNIYRCLANIFTDDQPRQQAQSQAVDKSDMEISAPDTDGKISTPDTDTAGNIPAPAEPDPAPYNPKYSPMSTNSMFPHYTAPDSLVVLPALGRHVCDV